MLVLEIGHPSQRPEKKQIAIFDVYKKFRITFFSYNTFNFWSSKTSKSKSKTFWYHPYFTLLYFGSDLPSLYHQQINSSISIKKKTMCNAVSPSCMYYHCHRQIVRKLQGQLHITGSLTYAATFLHLPNNCVRQGKYMQTLKEHCSQGVTKRCRLSQLANSAPPI